MSLSPHSFRVVHKPPLHPNFKRALGALPPHFNTSTQPDYLRFIHKYGTHFIRSVELGGRIQVLMALPTCKVTLDGFSVDLVGDCLTVENLVRIGGLALSSQQYQYCNEKRARRHIKDPFYRIYMERIIEVAGGLDHFAVDSNLVSRLGPSQYSSWLASLPSRPGLIHYSLEALHFLVDRKDPRREALRHAVNKHMMDKSPWWDCSKPCPPEQQKSPHDRCQCVCHGSAIITQDCCPLERGLAWLQVTIKRARNLWGDHSSATDAYVKVSADGQMLRTDTKWDTNNPTWMTQLDFNVVLQSRGDPPKVEVWDKDNSWYDGWDDDRLGSCNWSPKSGSHEEICELKHGHLEFSYEARCLPHLAGETCLDYVQKKTRAGPYGDNSEL